LEPAELVPVVPVADEVRVRDQDPRRPLVRPEDADRLPGLNQQGLVVSQLAEGPHDRVERVPGARRPAAAPVDDELIGVLGDFRIEVVHQHPQGGLLLPSPAGELGAPWGAHLSRPAHRSSPTLASTERTISPEATSRSATASSGASSRSPPGPGTPPSRIAASAAAVPAPGSSGARS